jgi:tRNA pseudouridine55 synthase
MDNQFVEGKVLLFDKPYEWTSFDVVGRVRSMIRKAYGLKKIKVGHAGTLDPLATGLMIVCTGKCTKQIDLIQQGEKEYVATIELGKTTPSFDKETQIDGTYPVEHITQNLINNVLSKFIGAIQQIPPVFSAKMIDGKRAYESARDGKEVEMKASTIEIKKMEVLKFEMPFLELKIVCSRGTYIRSLARDIGLELGSGAYLTALRRTRSGDYNVDNAYTIEAFENQFKLNDDIINNIKEKKLFTKTYNRHETLTV